MSLAKGDGMKCVDVVGLLRVAQVQNKMLERLGQPMGQDLSGPFKWVGTRLQPPKSTGSSSNWPEAATSIQVASTRLAIVF